VEFLLSKSRYVYRYSSDSRSERTGTGKLRCFTSIIKKTCAGFIYEPLVQGAAGMVMYEPESLDKLMQICKEKMVLTIADEVMTGFGKPEKYLRQIIW
jgi:adenosylmethionine-8-amino-7-oxononanoate aminotransferase